MTTKINSTFAHDTGEAKLRRDKKSSTRLEHKMIAILGIFSALMVGISLSILNPETGPLANFKVLLVTCSAGLVAYAVNRFAIERGTALTAIGYTLAGIASVISILAVGTGMFISAYSGLVHKAVDERVLQGNGSALVRYVGNINKEILDAARASPALDLIANDLTSYAECERKSSCLSRVGIGGYGPVATETQKLATRSNGIATAFDNGEVERRHLLSDINRLNTRYQEKLAETDIEITKRRVVLQSLHAEINQAGLALSETLPISLLKTYMGELQSGISIPGQLAASRNLSTILRQHGESLANILETLGDDEIIPPIFPPRPGMLDSFKYVSEFAAFAAVIFVAELVLPITLWILTYLKLAWEIDRRTPSNLIDEEPDGFDGLIELPPLSSMTKKPKPRNRQSRRSRNRARKPK